MDESGMYDIPQVSTKENNQLIYGGQIEKCDF
jgi:hypothetical protein